MHDQYVHTRNKTYPLLGGSQLLGLETLLVVGHDGLLESLTMDWERGDTVEGTEKGQLSPSRARATSDLCGQTSTSEAYLHAVSVLKTDASTS